MIVKSSSLVIAGMIVAGEAFAKHRRDTLPRATATTDTTPISITSATALSSTTAKYFTSSWPDFPSNFDEHQNYTIDYLVGDDIDTAFYQTQPSIDLILLYTTADTVPDGSNTYEVMSIKYTCDPAPGSGCFTPGATGNSTIYVEVNPNQVNLTGITSLSSFFLCFAIGVDENSHSSICESYSDFFSIDLPNIGDASSGGLAMRAFDAQPSGLVTPTVPLEISSITQVLLSGAAPTSTGSVSNPTTIISIQETVSSRPTVVSTHTITPISTSPPTEVTSETSKSSGLSVGAKVGIALGAVAFVLLTLIATLLCLRRRHNTRTQQPEHVMLTQNMHTGSRDLIAEKEISDPPTSVIETPIQEYLPPTHIPSNSHALSPFDDTPSAPYSGPAAAIPRRKPTAATMAPTVSRGVSDASGPISPRSARTRDGEDFEEYHDEPIYGDARHVPQVYEGALQAPFLSTRGMTAEELEEERRIDLAIAEAEGR